MNTTQEETIDEFCKKKFKHLSNEQLIQRANRAPDFKWDDEGCEIERRMKEDPTLKIEMQGNKLVIIT